MYFFFVHYCVNVFAVQICSHLPYNLELISRWTNSEQQSLRWGCWWLNVTSIIDLALYPLPSLLDIALFSGLSHRLLPPSPPPTLRHSMGNSRRAAGRASSDATVPSVILVSLLQAGVFEMIFYCIKTHLNSLKVLLNDGATFFNYFDTKLDYNIYVLEVTKQ